MKVSVVIPAKNEEGGIAGIIKAVTPYADEILVVDGHSKDKTREIAKSIEGIRVILDNGKGKGDGIKMGIKNAKGDILVFIDADGSSDARDIPKLVTAIKGGADLVIGSRTKGGSDEYEMHFDSFLRRVGSDLVAMVINYRFKVNLTDVENGFRAIKKETAKSLDLKANDFEIEQELVMKCLKKGFIIAEVPTHEFYRAWGKSKLPTTKGWKFILRLVKDLF